MSLGGYKFAGRYCTKGSLTDTQWALLVHKTRLAAFMASSALSGAGWTFDQTGGDIAFENHGNVIYSLDSVGNNYVSFVKHGTDSPSYTAILTVFKWGTSTGTGQIDGPWQLRVGSGPYIGACNSLYHRISSVQLTTSNLFSELTNATALLPSGFVMSTSQSYSGMTPSRTNSFPSQSTLYIGYAIKGEYIVSFASRSLAEKSIHVSVMACGARTNIIPSGNSHNTIASTFYGAYFSGAGATSYGDASDIDSEGNYGYSYGITIMQDLAGATQLASIFCPPYAQIMSSPISSEYPFCAVSLVASNEANANTIYKGNIELDFLATNTCPTKPSNRFGTYANGNLLMIVIFQTTSGFPYENYGITTYQTVVAQSNNGYSALYVGWDPSNPDITQASAWTEYTE